MHKDRKKTFFTSDTHIGHKNICRGTSSWEQGRGTRDFDSLEEMNQLIIDNINKCVGENDELYHLGDVALGGKQMIYEFMSKLKCKNVHLIIGNHDENIKKNVMFSEFNSNGVVCSDLFKSINSMSEIKLFGHKLILSHFPFETWSGVDRREKTFHLHGHVHGEYPESLDRLDVGIDNVFKIFGEYKPLSDVEILQYFKIEPK